MNTAIVQPEGEGEQVNVLVISNQAVAGLLRTLNEGLDYAMEALEGADGGTLGDALNKAVNAAGHFLEKLTDDIPKTEEDRREFARAYVEEYNNEDQVEGRRMLLGSELHEQVESPLTEEDVLVSVDGFRTFIRDVREELLGFSREDMEEVADVILAVASVSVTIAKRLTTKTLRLLENGDETNMDDRVQEALAEEVDAYYRSRGLTPPLHSPSAPIETTAPPPSKALSRLKKRRLIWPPLPTVLYELGQSVQLEASKNPIKVFGMALIMMPFSGFLFFLPGILVTDWVVQKVYGVVGVYLEEVLMDVGQFARLALVVTRLGVRQSYRFLRKQARRFKADPVKMASDVVFSGIDAAVHPFRTISQAKGAVTASYDAIKGWYEFLKDPSVPEPGHN